MNTNLKNTGKQLLNKVPEVTLFFWVIKVLCTTVGETFADFLNVNLGFGLTGTSITMGILLTIALVFQFNSKKYIPSIYWISVVFISVFGTLVTDNLTDKMGIQLETSTILFSVLLLITFVLWYVSEKTLSIHSIFTKRRELFYWLTILFTFALGTASGDLMAEGLGLGYLNTGIIVATVIAIVIVAQKLKLNVVLSFWIIYIMTRPLGASIGDFLSQPIKYGGLGLGATLTSVIFLLSILGIILYFTFTKRDVIQNENAANEENKESKSLVLQSLITIVLFVTIGLSAYHWRHNQLQKEIIQPTTTNNSGTTIQNLSTSELGDLSVFRKITEDTRNLVVSNNMDGAKTRVTDLEHEWDIAQLKLKAMNETKWTKVDDAIDRVLRSLRAVNPVQKDCISSLDNLIEVLK
ncbi:MAG: hypothetical protein EBS09_03250 [Flavobacteriia bacterium]|nr:hypothetical protein [Flavobacteriia bacterium]